MKASSTTSLLLLFTTTLGMALALPMANNNMWEEDDSSLPSYSTFSSSEESLYLQDDEGEEVPLASYAGLEWEGGEDDKEFYEEDDENFLGNENDEEMEGGSYFNEEEEDSRPSAYMAVTNRITEAISTIPLAGEALDAHNQLLLRSMEREREGKRRDTFDAMSKEGIYNKKLTEAYGNSNQAIGLAHNDFATNVALNAATLGAHPIHLPGPLDPLVSHHIEASTGASKSVIAAAGRAKMRDGLMKAGLNLKEAKSISHSAVPGHPIGDVEHNFHSVVLAAQNAHKEHHEQPVESPPVEHHHHELPETRARSNAVTQRGHR